MKLPHIILAGAASVSVLSVAAVNAQGGPTEAPGMVDPSKVSGGTYTADPAHSLVEWRVNHFGFNDYLGLFGDVDGTLTIDPENPGEASVEMTIPIASVTVPSEGLRDHLLRAGEDGAEPDFFGPEPAPATYRSTNVEISPGGMTAYVDGNLTMNGITKPVRLYARFTGAGTNPMSDVETIGFEGQGSIKRSEFGIDYALPMVGDVVDIEFSVAFEKK
ncbi:YceI family protein [Qipengyuania atrilutea]|uniref:YceI family protein n=1 Tax=Qipengyuania atrilutea TaxID=2744473 RepID=A0A850H192_9SPHN|nr:YceI family protein [Actirhodobacter atriluteus]NVD43713.1 YceI family protein [Actirhodobacter atriluteus]